MSRPLKVAVIDDDPEVVIPAGGSGFLTKPFQPAGLFARIEEIAET